MKFERALGFFQNGHIDAAESLCREVLTNQPRHAGALHVLGIIAVQKGQPAVGAGFIQQSLRIDSTQPQTHCSLGHAHRDLGEPAAALSCYQRAVQLAPDFAGGHYSCGNALLDLNRPQEALASYDRALTLQPDYAQAHQNRGNALLALGHLDRALDGYQQALYFQPNAVSILSNCADVLRQLKRPAEALRVYERLTSLQPRNVDLMTGRANMLLELGRDREALECCDASLRLEPELAECHRQRGQILLGLERAAEALQSFDTALRLKPDLLAAIDGRGVALQALHRQEEALGAFEHALILQPDAVDVRYRFAVALRQLSRHEAAAQEFARVVALAPDYDYALGNLLHARLQTCDWTDYEPILAQIHPAVGAGKRAYLPGPYFTVSNDAQSQLLCARTFVADKRLETRASISRAAPGNRRDRIVVAYISGDLRDHPVAQLMAGVFEAHAADRFDTIAISLTPEDSSPLGRRVRGAFGRFIDASRYADAEIAALARGLEVDIAVDLMGYSGGSRPAIWPERAAPIQVNFLGFPGTLGAAHYDYIIADPVVIPPAERGCYSEQVALLPECFQPNDARRLVADRIPTRSECGLPDTAFVFCCFNTPYKISPPVFDVWMRLLQRIQGSVLWLAAANDSVIYNLRAEASRRGVDPARLIFAPRLPAVADYLARYKIADLFLDTLPYNAHTTASDALWAGLPVVTCAGGTLAARVCASLLTNIGCPELIAYNSEDYEALAHRLATTPPLLSELRARLERNRATSPLFNTARYTRHLESAFTTMWDRWHRGESPESFQVPPLR